MLRLPARGGRSSARCRGLLRRKSPSSKHGGDAGVGRSPATTPRPATSAWPPMPQPVRMDSPEAGSLGGIRHHVAHAAGTEVAMRSFDFDKYCPPLGADHLCQMEIRGPVATPAGHVLLPTHREVMAAAFGLPLWVCPQRDSPGSRASSCVSAFHAAANFNCSVHLRYVRTGTHTSGFSRIVCVRCSSSEIAHPRKVG